MEPRSIKVGLPRAFLYHRYKDMWKAFFDALGVETVVSAPTVRADLDNGSAVAIDETCVSEKIWFGHVQQLIGKCDHILVPRISSVGKERIFCTRFEALPDITRAVFYASGQSIVDYNIDVQKKSSEEDAFIDLGVKLGFAPREAKRAYKDALRADAKIWKQRVAAEEKKLTGPGMKVLICAHSYVLEDSYIGKPVLDFLRENDVKAIRADICDRDAARRKCAALSPTCHWELNCEIMGSAALRADKVDGVILMSAFPCGPDSMVNEMMMRKIKGVPMLNIVLDGQNGTAGLETRLESFIDIIRFKEGLL
ncbi:MAG: acyl-CoA dehydratase activase-related protein [Clostridia bacterium]|nr:acyl-CoA dehydratase activase-related protein [Clostridia bacterium]